MVWLDSNSSDEEILGIVLNWVDVLAKEDYERVATALGYWDFDDDSAAKAIRAAIKEYRSTNFLPNAFDFSVSDWRLATGGNPKPKREVVWYQENAVGTVASVCVDLPLNGVWSDLKADFLLFERGDHPGQYQLRLEEITQTEQNPEEGGVCES